MKKWMIIFLVFCVLFLISIYILIPSNIKISQLTIINSTASGAKRVISNENKWLKWWPGTSGVENGKTFYSYNGCSFQVNQIVANGAEIAVYNTNLKVNTNLYILPLSRNSFAIEWQYKLPTSLNPIKRWQQFQLTRQTKNNMALISNDLKNFLETNSNIYGMEIKEIISKDSALITTKTITKTYPSISEIYSSIERLKKYVIDQNASQTNFPMLHVNKIDSTKYETMVAVPVNKTLIGNKEITFKRFVPWKTLTIEVKGGPKSIDDAFKQMQLYIEDHQRTSMAIPFEFLVTDRRMVQDTSKWISIICQPVS